MLLKQLNSIWLLKERGKLLVFSALRTWSRYLKTKRLSSYQGQRKEWGGGGGWGGSEISCGAAPSLPTAPEKDLCPACSPPGVFTHPYIGHLPLFVSQHLGGGGGSASCRGNRRVRASPQCCHGVAQLMYDAAEQQGNEEVGQLTGGQVDSRDLDTESPQQHHKLGCSGSPSRFIWVYQLNL